MAAGHDARLGEREIGTRDIVDMHPGDTCKIGVRDADGGVDIGLGLALCGPEQGELACRVPVEGALAPEGLGDVAEHRKCGERVGGLVVGPIEGIWRCRAIGHDTEVTPTQVVPCRRTTVLVIVGVMMSAATTGAGEAARHPARRVYVRGVRGGLGWRVAERLGQLDGIEVVVASGEGVFDPGVGHCDTVVDVGIADYDLLARRGQSVTEEAEELLAEADRLEAAQLVVVSSAMVYGAIANNPIPLTEEAVLRPDPTFVYARQLAAAEELIETWRVAREGRRVAMLRPAVPIAAGDTSSLARALTAGFGQRFGELDPVAQFVHHDDVAAAVAVGVEQQLDGVFNVAPDDAIPGHRVRELSGQRFRFPLPDRVAEVVGALRWRFQRGPIPPGLRSYTREPWIIANDKLRATGWAPKITNEQAYVEGTEAKWWTMVTPKRRQEITLGAMAVGVCAAGVVGLVIGRRWWRHRNGR